MKTCLLLALLWLTLAPAQAIDMTLPASVQITVRDKDGHPLPHAVIVFGATKIVLNAAGDAYFETHTPSPASDVFWTEHLRVTLAGFAPCDGDIRFFPGERGDLPVILFPPAKPFRQRFEDPPSGLPPHPLRLTLLTADGTPAAGWSVGPNAFVANSYSLVVGIVLPPINVYGTGVFLRTDQGGTASFGQNEDHIVIVSPEGLPFLYPLHPQTWPSGLHSITLRLPPLRRIQTGLLTDKDGRLAVHVALHTARARTGPETWEIRTETKDSTLFTNAEGRYALPQYYGTSYEYQAKYPLSAYDLAADHATLTSLAEDMKKPSEYKELTLHFVDEAGWLRPEFGSVEFTERQGPTQTLTTDGLSDRLGTHLFLLVAVDSVTATPRAKEWNTSAHTFAVPGRGDQDFTVIVPQKSHLKPLRGVLLGPDGKPVPGVTMPLFRGIDPRSGNTNNDFLQFSTTTDVQGRFAFAAAPDSCEIDLYRFGADQQPNLPGWIVPPRVTAQQRSLVIRLKPFLPITVRALLPSAATTAPAGVYLKSSAKNEQPAYLSPVFDAKTHTLLWNRIPPGSYTLTTTSGTLPSAARLNLPVALKPHSETRIDLRDKVTSFPQTPKPTLVTVRVSDISGEPVRGATVTLWTDREAWDRRLPADLTDDDGLVRLPLGIGQRGVAVAHVPGKLIGWTGLTGQGGEVVSVSALPAQTLTIPLKPLPLSNGRPPYDSRQVTLAPAAMNPMKPDEAQAVFTVLGLLPPNAGVLGEGPVPTVLLRPDASGNCVAEDLPPGTYHLQAGSDVTLTPGETAREVRLP